MATADLTTPQASTQIDVQKVDVNQMTVTTPAKSAAAQNWTALTPVLSVLIAALTLISTALIQIYQNHTTASLAEDSDWRSALAKVSMDESTAAVGTFEMQSFIGTPKHNAQARTLAAAMIPNIPDQYVFDTAFFALLQGTDQKSQTDVIWIARSVSNELRNLYSESAKLEHCSNAEACSLETFLMHPDWFYSDEKESNALRRTHVALWKLDSISSGLSGLWNTRTQKSAVQPGKVDLSGIIFMNNDFSGVDFQNASMDDVEFVGDCKVDPAKLPAGMQPACGAR